MPRGGPDYGLETLNVGQYSTDTAELAARLGSPYTVLRSGHVLYITDFQNGASDWAITWYGTLGAIARGINGWKGPACLGLLPDSVDGTLIEAYKIFPLVTTSKIGVEVLANWECAGALNNTVLEILQFQYIKPNSYLAEIKIDPVAKTIYVLSDTPALNTFYPIATGLDEWRSAFVSNFYQWAKLVIDWPTGHYSKFYWNNNVYNLSQYTPHNQTTFGRGYTGIDLAVTAAPVSTWLDIGAVIVTVDEP
ncbi:MAG: hypothetical protein ABSD73_12575 [Candidatus Bathyarchaeia archaeon]|jgi:hypothetical protein